MSYDTTSSELESIFSEVGEVVEIFVPTDRSTGRPRGFAFVEFTEKSAAAAAIEKFDGHELQGRNLRVSEAEERQRRPPSYSDGAGGGGYGAGHPEVPEAESPREVGATSAVENEGSSLSSRVSIRRNPPQSPIPTTAIACHNMIGPNTS